MKRKDHNSKISSLKPDQENQDSAGLSDPIVQLEILRSMEVLQDLQLDASERSVKPFTQELATRLVKIHRTLVHKELLNVDLVHFEYRSLVIRARLGIEDSSEVREVFSPTKYKGRSSPLEIFAREVNYEPGRDILPKVDCNFCTLLFMPDEGQPSESYIEQGIYPINSSGIKVLAKILKGVQLHPWMLGENKKRAFLEFSRSQGDLPAKWNETHKPYFKKRILPNFAGIFEFALSSAIRTMLMLSDELFEMYTNFSLCEDPKNCPPGQRRGKTSRAQLKYLRAKALTQLTGGASREVASRALTFVPIRMPTSDEAKGHLETIGLVAYYSNDPIKMTRAAALAAIEHLVFMTCRQYEGFKLRNQIRNRLSVLELQRIFARLMAHEATKPLGIIKDSLDLLDKAMHDSRAALAKFARGEFVSLQKKQRLDLYDVLAGLKSLRAARIDNLNVRYEDEIYSGTYVLADWDAARYTLGVLLDNAITHGNGRVRVWTKKKLDKKGHGRHVVVYLANNGDPMPQRLEEAITNGQPPIAPAHHRSGPNQGIGLNLAFEFARLNKWKLMYHRVEGDPKELRHVFELWFPSAEDS